MLPSSPKIVDRAAPEGAQSGFYGWHVDSSASYRGKIGWQVGYWTGPDDQELHFIPGIGVTYFKYNHHGTTAFTKVRLISMTGPSQ